MGGAVAVEHVLAHEAESTAARRFVALGTGLWVSAEWLRQPARICCDEAEVPPGSTSVGPKF